MSVLRRDLIRHPAGVTRRMTAVRLAVPENCYGLTLVLAVFDRCGNCGLLSSATGSSRPQFPVRGEGFVLTESAFERRRLFFEADGEEVHDVVIRGDVAFRKFPQVQDMHDVIIIDQG